MLRLAEARAEKTRSYETPFTTEIPLCENRTFQSVRSPALVMSIFADFAPAPGWVLSLDMAATAPVVLSAHRLQLVASVASKPPSRR